MGFRTFRVIQEDDPLDSDEIMCPASAEMGKRTTCDRCGLCSGHADGTDTRKNIAIIDHGVTSQKAREHLAAARSLRGLRMAGQTRHRHEAGICGRCGHANLFHTGDTSSMSRDELGRFSLRQDLEGLAVAGRLRHRPGDLGPRLSDLSTTILVVGWMAGLGWVASRHSGGGVTAQGYGVGGGPEGEPLPYTASGYYPGGVLPPAG